MIAKKQSDRISALANVIDLASAEDALAKTVISPSPVAVSQDIAPTPSRGPGRPPAQEKTIPLLVRVPEGLHEWLTERMLKETQEQRRHVTLQTIILQVLTAARNA